MHSPLISIVIPTYNRDAWLTRAVRSVLECHGNDVQIIVVPNGPHELWRKALSPFCSDDRVEIHALSEANGNAARTAGLRVAKGKYVRFLDDDDYLMPACQEQIRLMESTDSEVCSGRVMRVDQFGHELGLAAMPATRDFVEGACAQSAFYLPVSNVYLRTAIADLEWDPQFRRAQDYVWMLDLATRREWRWVHLEQQVGVWYQHAEDRVSSGRAFTEKDGRIIDRLLTLQKTLVAQGRQTAGRNRAIAQGIWHYVHRGFPYHPKFWSRVAASACAIDGEARPAAPHFHLPLIRKISPIAIEWTLLPARRAVTAFRNLRRNLVDDDYRRKL